MVRLHNGSFHHVALIEGDASYTALMRRLPMRLPRCIPLQFGTNWEQLRYHTSRALRSLNIFLGRPSTSEVGILASMVSQLLEATQAWLGDANPIAGAVLSTPFDSRLKAEEILDLFDYLELQCLTDKYLLHPVLGATYAAYADYGSYLCHNYLDAADCARENLLLQSKDVLHLDLSNASFSGVVMSLKGSNRGGSVEGSFTDSSLGLSNGLRATKDDDPSRELYWDNVSHRIRALIFEVYTVHVDALILTGPHAADKRLHTAVKKALHGLRVDEVALKYLEDLESAANRDQEKLKSFLSFSTARGAAEIAKRPQEGPIRCAQSEECRRMRKQVHGQGQAMLVHQDPSGVST